MQYISNSHNRSEIIYSHGLGVHLYDINGKEYLDFGAGVAVNALGHCHPKIVKTLQDQGQKLWHVSNLFRCQETEKLAGFLCTKLGASNVFFSNSGSEAVETAIKMMRKFHFMNGNPERNEIITFKDAFHGRSICNISAGGSEKYIEGFDPRLPGFVHAEFGNLADVASKISNKTAGILIEPIQGEGGVNFIGWDFLRDLRKICDENNILFALDEVQTGCSRTGKFFAYEWAEIMPDVLSTAKGLGGGFPIGATIFWQKMKDVITRGSHGSTFGGNPLATKVALAVCEEITDPLFMQNICDIAYFLESELQNLVNDFPEIILERRGFGLLQGLKFHKNIESSNINKILAENGLLTVSTNENILRFLPPLIIGKNDVLSCMKIMRNILINL